MSNSASLVSSSNPPVIPMDRQLRQLLEACKKGDFSLCIGLIDANPDILLSTTPYSNNCLHIAAMLNHHEFAKEVWSRAPSLFSGTNVDGETPLIAALMAGNLSLASEIITAASQYMQHDDLEEGKPLNRMLLKADRRNENALHHALRNSFEDLAVQLLDIEPRLSVQVTNINESPMYIAARRGFSKIIERLLEIPFSLDSGPNNESALHVAVEYGHPGITKKLLEGRSQLAYHEEDRGCVPLHTAITSNNLEMVKLLLEYDNNLAYYKQKGRTPFALAAALGLVSIAEEIMSTCPDSIYAVNSSGGGALHEAIWEEHPDFIDYILKTPLLDRFRNQADTDGHLPLHYAALKCNPKVLCSLLSHERQDCTATSVDGSAIDMIYGKTDLWKTLSWNESFTLLSNASANGWNEFVRNNVKKTNKKQATEDLKSLTAKYTSNTSLVAALLATVTFAAAFTLPGGFSSDPADAGLPIFARKAAFQVFLISDTIAMCCSLSVTFLCILATWEDLEFLLNYRKTTRALMWCAYVGTAITFGTGLFVVLSPNNLWLAILILVLCTILPFLSKIIGEWPLLMLRCRLRGHFQKDLVPNI